MGRRLRPYLPGASFHVTSRVQGREPLFAASLREAIAADLRAQTRRTDVQVLAYAIMPNHLHVVVRQASDPLCRLFQPWLRRVAVRTQRHHRRGGHVFEGPFREVPLQTPEHLRNAIVYTHLNPVRPGLCGDPAAWKASSFAAFVSGDGDRAPGLALEVALRPFAPAPGRTLAELAADYAAFQRWRLQCDAFAAALAAGRPIVEPPPRPGTGAGDAFWAESFRTLPPEALSPSYRPPPEERRRGPRRDLHDIALAVVAAAGGAVPLDVVRTRRGGTRARELRRRIVRQAYAVGYSGRQIADYLHIATSSVSRLLADEGPA